MQHTSGLPNYTAYIGLDQFRKVQHKFFHPHDLLAAAFAHPAISARGTKWEYGNTNYLQAGFLIEKVTERPVHEQITERVIKKGASSTRPGRSPVIRPSGSRIRTATAGRE